MAEDIFQTMDTIAEIRIVGGDEEKALSAAKSAILDIEKRFNIFDPRSELSQLCKNYRAKIPQTISEDLFNILTVAKEIRLQSGGLFNTAWTNDDKPANFVLDSDTKSITFNKKGIRINLGAIAKGYGADLALEEAKKYGAEKAMISLGGHINSFSRNEPWKLGLQDPAAKFGVYFGIVNLKNGSLSTSAENYRGQHIINPVNKAWKSSYQSVSVLHKMGIYADAISTALFLSAEKDLFNLIDRLMIDVIIIKEQKIILTQNMTNIFKLTSDKYNLVII